MDYVEQRNNGLYVAGTRVSLASVVHEFRNGAAPETILRSFPMLGTLERVYGAITYTLAHPEEVDRYMADQEQLWQQGRRDQPLPADLNQRIEQVRKTSSTTL